MTAPALLLCGSLTLDNVRTADGCLLPPRPGGNVLFAALGARLWSRTAGLVSRAGADYPGDVLGRLESLGLDTAGIRRLHAPHGMNVAFAYAADGSRVRRFPPAIMAAIPPAERARFTDYTTHGPEARFATWLRFAPEGADVPAAWARAARGTHLAAMPVERHLSLARTLRAAAPGARIHLDSPWHDERAGPDPLPGLLPLLDLLLPSEADFALWRPDADPPDAAVALAREAERPVLLKRGAAGALLLRSDGTPWLRVPALPVAVVDPTGAGDAFCGGLLAGLLETGDIAEALACATASASFAVESVGSDALLAATPAEAQRRRRLVHEAMA